MSKSITRVDDLNDDDMAKLMKFLKDKGYPENWPQVSEDVKDRAGWRCVRCGHKHSTLKNPEPCDEHCDLTKHPETYELFPKQRQRVLTVHHMDGRVNNLAHWNLAALCQVCHLIIQGVTQCRLDIFYYREDFIESEAWIKPFVKGWIENDGISTIEADYNPPKNWKPKAVK